MDFNSIRVEGSPSAEVWAKHSALALLVGQSVMVLTLTHLGIFFYLQFIDVALVCTATFLLAVLGRIFASHLKTNSAYVTYQLCVGMLTIFIISIMVGTRLPIILGYCLFPPIVSSIFSNWRMAIRWAILCAVIVPVCLFLAPLYTASALGQKFYLPIDGVFLDIFNGYQIITWVWLALFFAGSMDGIYSALVSVFVKQQRELEKSKLQIEKDQKYKDRFFATISHELRTPMTAIVGIADLIRRPNLLEPDRIELSKSLTYSSEHLLTIINDLLDLNKLQENKLSTVDIDFDLREVLYNAYNILKHRAADKGVDYSFNVTADLPKMVRGDGHRLTQVIVNILSNAVKFTSKGGIVYRAFCEQAPSDREQWILRIEIKDTGMGIAEDRKKFLFHDFVQADETIAMRYGGTGLGLSISKRLIELMGGSIRFDSKAGVGTTFYIEMPLGKSNAVAVVAQEPRAPIDLGKLRVLIVDDNHLNILVAKKQLEKELDDVSIDSASDGMEAIDIVKKSDYDLILMDLNMPRMDGIAATKYIRQMSEKRIADTPIIAMTANVGEKQLQDCIDAGMNDTLTKPFAIRSLLAIIEKHVPANRPRKA